MSFRSGGRRRVTVKFDKPSRAKQSFKEECDINRIVRKYQKDGVISHLNRFGGEYKDVTGAVDFHTANNIVLKAQETFMSLPSSVRQQFDNDPGAFMDFVHDPANEDKMVEMGLARKRVVPPIPAVDDPPKGGDAK